MAWLQAMHITNENDVDLLREQIKRQPENLNFETTKKIN